MNELKPCPFCGSRKTLEYLYPVPGLETAKVNCEHCMPKHIDLKDWNSRPIEDELESEIVILQKRIKELESQVAVLDGHIREYVQLLK